MQRKSELFDEQLFFFHLVITETNLSPKLGTYSGFESKPL